MEPIRRLCRFTQMKNHQMPVIAYACRPVESAAISDIYGSFASDSVSPGAMIDGNRTRRAPFL